MFPQRVVLQKQILQKVADGVFSELSYLPHCLNVPKLYQILKYKGASVACSLEENPEVNIKNNVFHPKLLIGADGLHSRVRKQANLEATIPKMKRWG